MKIDTQDIRLSYGAKEILKGVSINVPCKKFVGVIGPNGSGKSTMLKCIYRVLKPTGGCVSLNGEKLEEIS